MDLTGNLKLFGLSSYDARVYAALLRAEWLPVRDIAETAALPIPNVYPALERLRRRGLVTINRNKLKRYSALTPSAAFRKLLDNERALIQRKDYLLEELDRLHEKRKSPEHGPEAIEVLGTDPVAFGALMKRVREARSEVLATNAFSYRKLTKATARKGDSVEQEILKRGVRVRCIYSPSQLAQDFERERLKGNIRAGEEARVSDKVPMNIIVIDDDVAAFTLPDSSSKCGFSVYRANEPQLAVSLRLMFEQLWQNADEFTLADLESGRGRPVKRTARNRKTVGKGA